MRKAEGLRTLTEENIKNSQASLRQVQDKLRSLNAHLEDLKRITTKSNSILNDANNVRINFLLFIFKRDSLIFFILKSIEKLDQKVKELKNLTTSLEDKTKQLMAHFETNTQPKTNEALNLYANLNSRSDSVLKQAEQVTNRTQKLLDNANNALESLNKINRSLSGIYLA